MFLTKIIFPNRWKWLRSSETKYFCDLFLCKNHSSKVFFSDYFNFFCKLNHFSVFIFQFWVWRYRKLQGKILKVEKSQPFIKKAFPDLPERLSIIFSSKIDYSFLSSTSSNSTSVTSSDSSVSVAPSASS
jgi:hypothetical protein